MNEMMIHSLGVHLMLYSFSRAVVVSSPLEPEASLAISSFPNFLYCMSWQSSQNKQCFTYMTCVIGLVCASWPKTVSIFQWYGTFGSFRSHCRLVIITTIILIVALQFSETKPFCILFTSLNTQLFANLLSPIWSITNWFWMI